MAVQEIRRLERRGRDRLVIPPCLSCGKPTVQVATRTDYYLYLRCGECWHIWSIPKPGRRFYGT
jgi:hypothetical protein